MRNVPRTIFFWPLLCAVSCIDPYSITISNEEKDLLVVDGFLNTTAQKVTVKLSNAIGIGDGKKFTAVTGAALFIEEESGAKTKLTEYDQGNYEVSSPAFTSQHTYRLAIELSNGHRFFSEYIQPLQAVPIDSISWKPTESGITIYANAHDDHDKSRYYKWRYTETWSYLARYYSFFKLVDGEPVLRTQEENLYYCWGSEKSTDVLVNSTVKLTQNRVSEFSLTQIAKGARKISRTYSIIVEQIALDEKAYHFWTELKKTTENLGGLFDPLPSQVLGNLYAEEDPTLPVLGYFNGGSVEQKRIYIHFYDLPNYLWVNEYGKNCELGFIPIEKIKELPKDRYLIDPVGSFAIVGYTTATAECADCTSFAGSTTKPDFWP